ncbi:MAG: serine hydrolase, partial [Gemmatimonadetes bacterium]|nr:serine hydrolase [Gemmatimonadota bacterium]
MRFLTLAFLAVTSAGCAEPSTRSGSATDEPDLSSLVTARLDSLDAISTLWAKHLPSGREIAVRADRPMNTLSVIKIPIMVQAFRDAESGRLSMDRRYTVEPQHLRRGSGLVQTFAPGLSPTLRDLVTQMIITSDNTATDMVLDAVGLDRVNTLLDEAGYEQTRVKMSTGDLFREVWVRVDSANASLTHRQVYERGFPSDEGAAARSFALEGDSTVWLGRTTAREMGRLLEEVLNAELTTQESAQAMISVLSSQFYSSRLPQRVRWQNVAVAHKTGDWPPIAGNDVGILFYDGGPTIVSVFTNQNTGD